MSQMPVPGQEFMPLQPANNVHKSLKGVNFDLMDGRSLDPYNMQLQNSYNYQERPRVDSVLSGLSSQYQPTFLKAPPTQCTDQVASVEGSQRSGAFAR